MKTVELKTKIAYIMIFAFVVVNSNVNTARSVEKINANVSYEYYMDSNRKIKQEQSVGVSNLPQVDDTEINLAYYKGFRSLDMLSKNETYKVETRKLNPIKFDNTPKEYSISFLSGDLSYENEITPSSTELVSRAMNLKQAKNYDKALEYIEMAIKKDSSNPSAYFIKADILRLLGRNAESIASYALVIEINPYSTDAYYNIAKIFENSNKKDLALEYYRYAYTTNPNDNEIRRIILNYEKANISKI